MATTTVREPPRRRTESDPIDWSLLSSQGRVLFYIAFCPGCDLKEIARAAGLTERAVWGIVVVLRRSGMVHVQKMGRRHTYQINLDAPLFHPTISGFRLGDVLGPLVDESGRNRSEQCLDPSGSPGSGK